MSRTQPWYIGERAEALARVYLTRRSDLRAKQEEADYGVDFIVEITKNSQPTRRVFGVQVRAQVLPIKEGILESRQAVSSTSEKVVDEILFPLCLFVFTMENDEGFYQWVLEPVISDGSPKLRPNTTKKLNKLDNAALEQIVNQVNQWYDALLKTLAA